MSKTKVQTKAPESAARQPIVQKQPQMSEQQGVRSLDAARGTSVLPPPNGLPPAARAAELMRAPAQRPGLISRARTMSAMQQTMGNARVSRLLGTTIQAKLTVGAPNDVYEQEAERVADHVMRMPSTLGEPVPTGHPRAGPEETIQRSLGQTGVDSSATPTSEVEHVIASPGSGHQISDSLRTKIEPVLGSDLSDIRVHSGEHAHRAAASIQARAFAHQSDIWLGRGESPQDLRLMAHEAAHTVQQRGGPYVARHPVAPTPVARRANTDLFGDGSPANPGMTYEDFERYTRGQADWFTEPTLTAADRNDLWNLLLRINEGPHILAGAGDLRLRDLRSLTAADWTNLSAFGRACHSRGHTVRVLSASAYPLTRRMSLGATLIRLEGVIPPAVLEVTVSESQFLDLESGGLALMGALASYWATFDPHLQMTYTPAPGARAGEFQRVLDLLRGPGIVPFMPLIGRVRNLHRFSVALLARLVTNFGNHSRSRPVHLVLHTGHDAGAFQGSAGVFEDLILNSPNLVLMLEGQASLAAITAQIPLIAAAYGQPDASGHYRVAQVMIAGHGQARSVELAGTGAPIMDRGGVRYASESLDLDTNAAATTALLDTLLRNLDPATARVVFAGCLVGSNPVPAGTSGAAIPGYLSTHESLGAYTQRHGVALGLSPSSVLAARASVGLGSATSLRDAAGNLTIDYPFDPTAFGSAVAYVVDGHEPEGLLRAAVEVAATAGLVIAETHLRTRLTRRVTAGWYDEITLALVNVALIGVAVGAGVSITRLNDLAHMAETPFLARWPSDYGITAGSFAGNVNNQPALAGEVYIRVTATPTFMAPPDDEARAMRLIIEQGWLAFGAPRTGPLIAYLDTTSQLTTSLIERYLDTRTIASHSATLFPSGAVVTSGRVRLALAWLQKEPTNGDVRAFLNGQVSMGVSGATLSAAVRAELDGLTEREILETLGRLTATTSVSSGGGGTVSLPSANAEITGDRMNRARIEPRPYIATVLPHALNVRRRPTMSGTVFSWLSRGDVVHVMGFVHNWAAIDQGGRLGFVYRVHLTPP